MMMMTMSRFSYLLVVAFLTTSWTSSNCQAKYVPTTGPPQNFDVDIALRDFRTTNSSSLSDEELAFIVQMYSEVYTLTHPDVNLNTFEIQEHTLETNSRRRSTSGAHRLRSTKRITNVRLQAYMSLACLYNSPDDVGSICILPSNVYILYNFEHKFCRFLRDGPFESLHHVRGCSIHFKKHIDNAASIKKSQPSRSNKKNATTHIYTEHVKLILMNLLPQHGNMTATEGRFLEQAWLAVYKDLNQDGRVHAVKLESHQDHHLPIGSSSSSNKSDPFHRRTTTKSYFHYWYGTFSIDASCNLCFGRRLVAAQDDDDDGVMDDDVSVRRSLKQSTNNQMETPLFDKTLLSDFEDELCAVLRDGPHPVFHTVVDCILAYDQHV